MRTTITRLLAVGSALGLLALVPPAAATAGAEGSAPTKASTHGVGATVSCNDTEGDDDGSSWGATAADPANMRSGPSTGCGINGVLQTSDRADYHCFKFVWHGDDLQTWTYLRDDRTGAYGWVLDDLLEDGGSGVEC